MKLTNEIVFSSKEALQHLVDRDDIPIKYALPIARMVKKLNEEIVLIDEKRIRLVKKYGEEDEGQIKVTPSSAKWEEFVRDFNELLGLETDINFDKVKVPSAIVLPTKDVIALEPFLEVVDEPK